MLAENLQKLRKRLSLGQNEFALKLSMLPRAYVNYERGERKPPYELLVKLSDEFDVNLNWLIADKGDMFNKKEPAGLKDEIKQAFKEMIASGELSKDDFK